MTRETTIGLTYVFSVGLCGWERFLHELRWDRFSRYYTQYCIYLEDEDVIFFL